MSIEACNSPYGQQILLAEKVKAKIKPNILLFEKH